MSIVSALRSQQGSIRELAMLPQQEILKLAQSGQLSVSLVPVVLNEKALMIKQSAQMQAAAQPKPPTVVEQAMATNAQEEAMPQADVGIATAPVREDMYQEKNYAGGGIVAFDEGGEVVRAQRGLYVNPTFSEMIRERETGGLANPDLAVSPKGAMGLMQIMPRTAMQPGYGVPDVFKIADELGIPYSDRSEESAKRLLTNRDVNKRLGDLYAGAMLQKFGGDPRLAAAAYNAGPGAVERAGGIPDIAETKRYVAGISPERMEAASDKVRQARREQLADFSLSPTGVSMMPYRSVMEREPEKPVELGTAPSPFPSKQDIAGRQQLFSDYLSGAVPLPAPTRAQQMMKERLEEPKPAEEKAPEAKKPKEEEKPKEKSYEQKLDELITSLEGRRAAQREEDKSMAILAAGLGMLGGTSPYALQNIGAGAMKGVEQYAASRKLGRQEDEDILAARLGQYRYGEESKLRSEGRKFEQGMRLASDEEKRTRDYLQKVLSDFTDPRRKSLIEEIKKNPDFVETQAITARNRILKKYGIETGEEETGGSSRMIDYSSILSKKK